MSDPAIKRFKHLKFFACGGLILYVLIKEISEQGIKRFQDLKFFACSGLLKLSVSTSRGVRIKGKIAMYGQDSRWWRTRGGAPHLSYYRKLLLSTTTKSCKGNCIFGKCERGAVRRRRASYVTEKF